MHRTRTTVTLVWCHFVCSLLRLCLVDVRSSRTIRLSTVLSLADWFFFNALYRICVSSQLMFSANRIENHLLIRGDVVKSMRNRNSFVCVHLISLPRNYSQCEWGTCQNFVCLSLSKVWHFIDPFTIDTYMNFRWLPELSEELHWQFRWLRNLVIRHFWQKSGFLLLPKLEILIHLSRAAVRSKDMAFLARIGLIGVLATVLNHV